MDGSLRVVVVFLQLVIDVMMMDSSLSEKPSASLSSCRSLAKMLAAE